MDKNVHGKGPSREGRDLRFGYFYKLSGTKILEFSFLEPAARSKRDHLMLIPTDCGIVTPVGKPVRSVQSLQLKNRNLNYTCWFLQSTGIPPVPLFPDKRWQIRYPRSHAGPGEQRAFY